MKNVFKISLVLVIFIIFCLNVKCENNIPQEIYESQLKSSGAAKLQKSLPDETLEILQKIGIPDMDWKNIAKIDVRKIFEEVASSGREKFISVFSSAAAVIGILIICAAIKNFSLQKNGEQIEAIASCLCSLCLCRFTIFPISKCLSTTKLLITSAANFVISLSAVMAGFMAISGKTISASAYHCWVLIAGELLSRFLSNAIIPILNVIFGISLISSISQQINLEQLCKTIHKSIQIFLKFFAGFFVGILTLQNVITDSADNLGASSVKFMLDNCIPIVGGAISDAFGTVKGCLNLLKSSVGAFGILAGVAMFLPIFTECIAWIVFLNLCKFLSDTFELKKSSLLISSVATTVKTLIAILTCTVVILISSAGIIMVLGG